MSYRYGWHQTYILLAASVMTMILPVEDVKVGILEKWSSRIIHAVILQVT